MDRNLVKTACQDALSRDPKFNPAVTSILVNLIMFCMRNVITQYKKEFFTQENGIITENNHSVSIANISVHYVVKSQAIKINEAELFVRFIDDILRILKGKENTQEVEFALTTSFGLYGLNLKFRHFKTTSFHELEFLDVLHVVDENSRFGFVTKNFKKLTAKDRCFLNGKSHHPPHVFRSIVYGECIRMRRLNERDEDFLNSLDLLEKKCILSEFNEKMTKHVINLAKGWKDRFGPEKPTGKSKQRRVVWATSFSSCLQLSQKEEALQPEAAIVYKRPQQ